MVHDGLDDYRAMTGEAVHLVHSTCNSPKEQQQTNVRRGGTLVEEYSAAPEYVFDQLEPLPGTALSVDSCHW